MLTVTATAHLQRHQDGLSALLDAMVSLLAGEVATARPELARLRWSFVRRARAYQLFKHGEIFGPVIAAGTGAQRAVGEEMRRACLAAGAEVEAHVRRWGGRDIAAEWRSYRIEALAIARRTRRHLVTERQQIARLLAGTIDVRRVA